MTEDPSKERLPPKYRWAATIGGILGTAAGLGVYKLTEVNNSWLMLGLMIVCCGLALVLAKTIASKID